MRKKDKHWEEIQDYFLWLVNIIEVEGSEHYCTEFLWTLFRREFYWSVPNDNNRAEDGKKLREAFLRDNGLSIYSYYYGYLDGPCSVLELLIGLAYRIDFILMSSDNEPRVHKWFWEMVDNLKLEQCSDNDPYIKEKMSKNHELISVFLDRKYDRFGNGGIFPLKHYTSDQREVEIWYQMMTYLDERYPE
jgi:hypothetical protein